MRLVDRPAIRPQHCAAIPYIGQTAEGERWVDTGSEMPGFDNHVYLSETAIRAAAGLLGFPSPTEYQNAVDKATNLLSALEAAEARIKELEEFKAAVRIVQRRPKEPVPV